MPGKLSDGISALYHLFLYKRRSDVVLEEKPESSLVKKVSIAGHVTKDEEQPGEKVDSPPQG